MADFYIADKNNGKIWSCDCGLENEDYNICHVDYWRESTAIVLRYFLRDILDGIIGMDYTFQWVRFDIVDKVESGVACVKGIAVEGEGDFCSIPFHTFNDYYGIGVFEQPLDFKTMENVLINEYIRSFLDIVTEGDADVYDGKYYADGNGTHVYVRENRDNIIDGELVTALLKYFISKGDLGSYAETIDILQLDGYPLELLQSGEAQQPPETS